MVRKEIKKLSEQLDAAQHTLEELRKTSGCDLFPPLSSAPEERYQVAYNMAVRSVEGRRARSRLFPNSQMFGDAGWDMLLDLYIRQFHDDTVSVRSARVGSGTSATTGLWLKLLEEQKLISTEDDPAEKQRKLVRLTPEGYESLTRYLNELAA